MPALFDSIKLGDLTLPNRILMSPLTRCRASAGRVPNAMMAEYYAQRASAGLIFSKYSYSSTGSEVGFNGPSRGACAGEASLL
jgi:2,4-dienoyl-CoA reductase-like NADH-dependent reductase (Old Yellow Enzyme family)